VCVVNFLRTGSSSQTPNVSSTLRTQDIFFERPRFALYDFPAFGVEQMFWHFEEMNVRQKRIKHTSQITIMQYMNIRDGHLRLRAMHGTEGTCSGSYEIFLGIPPTLSKPTYISYLRRFPSRNTNTHAEIRSIRCVNFRRPFQIKLSKQQRQNTTSMNQFLRNTRPQRNAVGASKSTERVHLVKNSKGFAAQQNSPSKVTQYSLKSRTGYSSTTQHMI